ncbi:MAG: IclR family transcriptional regulator [Devosia nanyangense]|uniref:IclR family transcriptional regulator n=1 Tax=Devosia nanyangense TaxID=1228055 RepID=A0A933L539_9HYPH|nr:IclR family transcriptional regulator [Devosia nanyangense]
MASHDDPLTVDQITAETGLPKTTVFRVLATLEKRAFITREATTQAYRFGEMALLVGARALGQLDVKLVARPFIEELMEETGETVHLSILNQTSALCIDKIDSRRSVRMLSFIGFRDPLYCSGVGKVLLAFQPDGERETLISSIELAKRTARTVTDRQALSEHLRGIREQGYALDLGEIEDGLSCVAAPIRDHGGRVVAAVSVSGPDSRIDEGVRRALIPVVVAKAQRVSKALGYLADGGVK